MLYIHIIVCFCCAAKYVSVAHKYLAWTLRYYSWECSWGERVILGAITTQINQSRRSVCLSVVKFTLPLVVDFLLNLDSQEIPNSCSQFIQNDDFTEEVWLFYAHNESNNYYSNKKKGCFQEGGRPRLTLLSAQVAQV